MRRSRLVVSWVLAAGLFSACGGLDDIHQRRLFPGPVLQGERVADLDSLPADLEIGADGAWSPAAQPLDPAPGTPPPYKLNGETLLVPVARGTFEARIDRILAPSGVPQIGWSLDAGVLAAAARGGRGRPGTILVIVRLWDGTTKVVAGWEMAEEAGYQGITAMRISPDGSALACQLVENHPGGKEGFREVARRGLVVTLGDDGTDVLDLGPDIDGPMRWSPDGRDLYYVRGRRGPALYRVRVPGAGPVRTGSEAERMARSSAARAPGVTAAPPAVSTHRAAQEEVLEPIMQLSSGDAAEKVAAAQRLAGLPHPMAVGPLIQALEAGDPALCRAAAEALRAILANPQPPSIGGAAGQDCSGAAGAWREFWSSHPEALVG